MRNPKSSIPVKILYWSSQITTMSFEMGIFIGLGIWADSAWGTKPWMILAGCGFGFLTASWHLYQLVRSMNRSSNRESRQASPGSSSSE